MLELESIIRVRTTRLEHQLSMIDEKIKLKKQQSIVDNSNSQKNDTELNYLYLERLMLSKSLALKESPQEALNTKILPSEKVNYFHIVSSEPAESYRINSIFVFIFLFFVSLLFHLMMVILIDLKMQIDNRLNTSE